MLHLTRKADYGLRLMPEVAAHTEGAIRTADVARRQGIPYEFLRKVAQTLVSNGLLASQRGVRGGISLARPAKEISVLDIVRAFGAPSLNRCTIVPPRCDRRASCPIYPVWVEAQKEVDRILGGTSVSELVERQAELGQRGKRPYWQREARESHRSR